MTVFANIRKYKTRSAKFGKALHATTKYVYYVIYAFADGDVKNVWPRIERHDWRAEKFRRRPRFLQIDDGIHHGCNREYTAPTMYTEVAEFIPRWPPSIIYVPQYFFGCSQMGYEQLGLAFEKKNSGLRYLEL